MSFIKSKFLRTVTSMLLIVAMAVGMTAGMEKKADAATKITITYNLNGGTVSPYDSTKIVKKSYNSGRVTLQGNSYYYPGRELVGWSLSKGGPKKYSAGQITNIYSDLTLYAIWCSHGSYTQKTITESTCEVKGKATRTCKTCGKQWTAYLPLKSHNWKVTHPVDDARHERKCNSCGKTEIVSHDTVYVANNGSHYPKCSAGCTPMHMPALSPCRNYVKEWYYYVDKVTFASDGCNLYMRIGTCSVCGTGVMEYGYVGFISTSGKGKTFSNAVETIIAVVKFGISFYKELDPRVKLAIKVHTAIGVLIKLKNAASSSEKVIAHADTAAYEAKLTSALSTLNSLQYMNPSDVTFKEELKSAKNYFNNPKNMKATYEMP